MRYRRHVVPLVADAWCALQHRVYPGTLRAALLLQPPVRAHFCADEFWFLAANNDQRLEVPRCGDGILDIEVESCDDGNVADGDGCDQYCHLEIPRGCADIDKLSWQRWAQNSTLPRPELHWENGTAWKPHFHVVNDNLKPGRLVDWGQSQMLQRVNCI